MAQNTCPPSDRFQALLQGDLPPDVAESIAQHVEQCAACATTVANLEHDTLADALRAGGGQSYRDGPALQKLLERTRASVASGPDDATNPPSSPQDVTLDSDAGSLVANANETLHLLSKPQGPGEIGRLGHYRILRQLGQGGMGMVFEAEDMKLERRVALKVMKPEIARNDLHRERFLREARTAAKVESDHICPIYQVGEENGMPFIAMPFLKGEPLDARVKRGMRLPVDEIVRIGLEVAEGLSAAHEAGLIHRDIKPGNIWLETRSSGKSRARILDFGLARVQNDDVHITTSGAILGTPAYMAPEQARGEKTVDARADLFSLGCVLYALCTGDIPFKAETTMGVLMALATHEPKPPHEISNAIPRPLSELIMQLLQKDAERRPASAREVIDRLAKMTTLPAAQPEASPAPAPSPTGDASTVALSEVAAPRVPVAAVQKSKSRMPLAIALACGFLACVLVLLGGVVYLVTNNGTIEIKTEDKNVKIIVEEAGGKVTILDPMSKQTWVLNTGKYTIKHDGNPDSLEIELPADRAFEMKRGGKQVVSIRKKEPTPIVVAKKTEVKESERTAAEWVLSAGGTLNLRADGKTLVLKKNDSIPASPFEVNEISMMHVKDLDDVSVENLQSAPKVASLRLHDNKKLGDAGLAKLTAYPGFTNLTKLVLNDTAVTDAGLENVTKFKGLTELHLGASKLSPKSLVPLRSLKLQTMTLYECHNLGDAAMAELASFPRLESLTLSYIPISDAGLENLAKCKTLRTLVLKKCAERATYLKRTPMSESGVKKLAAARPDVRIVLEDVVFAPGIDPERRAAEWVLAIGGNIEIKGVPRPITRVGELPMGAVELLKVDLDDNQKVNDVGLANFKDCRNLAVLRLASTKVSDEGLAYFKDCKNLRHLSLIHTAVSDVGLAHFNDCKQLVNLFLGNTNVSEAWLVHLKDFKDLEILHLSGTKTKDTGLVHIKDLTNIKSLHLRDTSIGDAGLAHIKNLSKLTDLELSNTKVSDDGLEQLKELNLIAVGLAGTKVKGRPGLGHLKKCKSVAKLHLDDTEITDADLADLASMKLVILTIERTRISLRGREMLTTPLPGCSITWSEPNRSAADMVLSLGGSIEIPALDKDETRTISKVADLPSDYFQIRRLSLAGCRKPFKLGYISGLSSPKFDCLESIDLSGTMVVDYAGLANIPKLRELNLAKSGLNDDVLAKLPILPALKRLVLDDNEIRGSGLAHLSKQPALIDLSLAGPRFGDLFVKNLAELKQLERLSLAGSGLTNEGVPHLASLKNLASIDLRKTKVNAAGIDDLKKRLPGCRIEWDGGVENATVAPIDPDRRAAEWLLSIAGTHTQITVKQNGKEWVAKGLPEGAFALTGVNLMHNSKVTDASLANLKDCKDLTLLNLGYTGIGDEGVSHFKDCKKLTSLYLPGRVTAIGMANFKNCKDLKELALHGVTVNDVGLSFFSQCKGLTRLSLRSSALNAVTLAHFKDCNDLKFLDLADSNFKLAELVYFKNCANLEHLDLANTKVGDADAAHFKDCKNLKLLILDKTNVTDKGIALFTGCKNLTSVMIAKTSVTKEGVNLVRDALPRCRIEWDGGIIETKRN